MEFRTLEASEFDAFLDVASQAFLHDAGTEEQRAPWRAVFEPDRALCAFDAGEIVATSVIYPLRLGVPGAVVPTAGVSGVTTRPTHRRRGLLSTIMQRQLEASRARGEPLAALVASESSIYGRYGFGSATVETRFEIDRRHTRLRDVPRAGRVRVVDGAGFVKLVPTVIDRLTHVQPGAWNGNPNWMDLFLHDPPGEREGAMPLSYLVHEDDAGQVDGYALYRARHGEWSDGFPDGSVDVEEAVALTPAAEAAIWEFVFGIDLVGTIKGWTRPFPDPVRLLLTEPRRMRQRAFDGLWLRLLDVEAALAARRYRVPGELVLEVSDAMLDANAGRFVLSADESGGASVTRTKAAPDVSLDVGDLGATYLGGVSFDELAWAGRLAAHTAAAVARADTLFAWDPRPWTMAHF